MRSALRSCSLGRPGRTRVFPLPSRAAPSWGLPCALCCHPPLWEELNFPAVSAMSGEDQLFKVDGRSELGRAFTLEAPRQGSGCLGESSLRAGGPAASSSRDTPEGRRAFQVLLEQRAGRGSCCLSGPHAWTARAAKLIQMPPHMQCLRLPRGLCSPAPPVSSRWSALQPRSPRRPAGGQLCSPRAPGIQPVSSSAAPEPPVSSSGQLCSPGAPGVQQVSSSAAPAPLASSRCPAPLRAFSSCLSLLRATFHLLA